MLGLELGGATAPSVSRASWILCQKRASVVLAVGLALPVVLPPVFHPPTSGATAGTRLDTDPAGRGVNSSCQPRIAAGPNSTLHVVWQDFRSPQWQIAYRRCASFGTSLASSDTILSSIGNAVSPRVATNPNNANVYVTWRSRLSNGSEHVYFTRSVDGGVTWPAPGSEMQLSLASDFVGDTQIAADGLGGVYVIWSTNSGIGDALFFARSTDQGQTFTAPMALTLPSAGSSIRDARVFSDGGSNVYVAFILSALGATVDSELWFYESGNQGGGWSSAAQLAKAPYLFEVTLAGNTTGNGPQIVHVVWNDNNRNLFSQRRTTSGSSSSWLSSPLQIESTPGLAFGLDLACDVAGNAYVAYTKVRPATTSDAFAGVLPVSSSTWQVTDLSGAPALPAGLYSRTSARVAVSGNTAAAVWMQQPTVYNSFADVRMAYSTDLGQTWTAPTVLNGAFAQQTRAGFPQVIVEPGRLAAVWDERRHWTPPGSEFGGHGAPETFLRVLETP